MDSSSRKIGSNTSCRVSKGLPCLCGSEGFRKRRVLRKPTKLYVALGAKQQFVTAYSEPRSGSGGGNGIHLIGWSANGEKLLAEVNSWKYETDSGFWHVPLIYDASTGRAAEIRGLDKALTRYFGPGCEFEPSVKGWKGRDEIVVEVSRPPEDESYEQHFCVSSPRLLVYDVQKETVQPESTK